MKKYCYYCKSKKPLWKAGMSRYWGAGGSLVENQKYECQNCHKISTKWRKQK